MNMWLEGYENGLWNMIIWSQICTQNMVFPSNKACQNIDFQGVWFIDFLILIIDFQTDSLIDFDQSKALFFN